VRRYSDTPLLRTLDGVADIHLPSHVVVQRRDGRREVVLHRSLAVMSEDKIEIRSARSTVLLPLAALVVAGGLIAWIALSESAPFWGLVVVLLACLFLVPVSVMGLVGAIAGADVVVDARKGSVTWQQGYLGMGIGTKELVPFPKIDHLEVTIEGDQPDRWREQSDDLRQFALSIVKTSGKRLIVAQVPVPAYGQADGMDRTLAVGHAVAALTGSMVTIPEGWELLEVDADTLEPVTAAAAPAEARRRRRRKR
jgi:hypothetical protein